MPNKTYVFERRGSLEPRLMHTIQADSQFFSLDLPKEIKDDQDNPVNQLKIARLLKDGWVKNGGKRAIDIFITQHVYKAGRFEEREYM